MNIGLPVLRTHQPNIGPVGGRVFSISSLFAGGTQGFDFTDLDITPKWGGTDLMPLLYRDTACFIVTGNGQQVGVMLDKSKGFALGSEAITNGDFASGSGWSMDAGWSIGGGVATHAVSGAVGDLTTTAAVGGYATGDQVRCSIDMVSGAAGGTINQKGPFQDSANAANPANGSSYIAWGLATNAGGAAGGARVTASATFAKSVDNFSIKKMAGFAAQQSTSASRPTWQANSGFPYLNPDGSDDYLATLLAPAASTTLVACVRVLDAGTTKVIVGTVDAGNGRCRISTRAGGFLSGSWGSDQEATITDTVSRTGTDAVVLMRGNASFVELWVNGVRTYRAAPNGPSPSVTTAPFFLAANNSSGTPGAFYSERIYRALAVQSFVADADVVPLMRAVGQGIVTF